MFLQTTDTYDLNDQQQSLLQINGYHRCVNTIVKVWFGRTLQVVVEVEKIAVFIIMQPLSEIKTLGMPNTGKFIPQFCIPDNISIE